MSNHEWLLPLQSLFGIKENFFQENYIIEKGRGRRLVIGDIHGCFKTFKSLLQKLELKPEDQLFLVGDMVNRGANSGKTVDLIFTLIENGYNVYPLRGNHEEQLLLCNAKSLKSLKEFTKRGNSRDLLNKKGFLKKRYRDFFSILPYYFQTDKAFIVHAGFDFGSSCPFQGYKKMMEVRDFPVPAVIPGNRLIVHGHNPKPMEIILQSIQERKTVIPIDNGCVGREFKKGYGNLICLNIDSLEIIFQKNIE